MGPTHPPTELSRQLHHLAAHGFELDVQPGYGGRLVSLRHDGENVFYPDAQPATSNILAAGCFPLVPFSNRIRRGAFEFAGRTYHLDRNWDGDEHAIHGNGWISAWPVNYRDDTSMHLSMISQDWWPWTYQCDQHISLSPGRVSLSLSLTNLDRTPMPAGLGFHPYFPRGPRTQLQFQAAGVIEPMSDAPVQVQPLSPRTDFSTPASLASRNLDHGYSGWQGEAKIVQPGQGLDLLIRADSAATGAVVYAPNDAPFFCFEPVTQINGAFEMEPSIETGLRVVAPGESFQFTLTIDVRTS